MGKKADAQNTPADDWMSRLRDEYAELKDRRLKLESFLNGKVFQDLKPDEQTMLTEQAHHMTMYQQSLEERLTYYNRPTAQT